mgnify:CR=1 FL=1
MFAGSNKRLSDLAQVQLKGNSVVILTLFSEQHLSKVPFRAAVVDVNVI